jgi:hypothetical protein
VRQQFLWYKSETVTGCRGDSSLDRCHILSWQPAGLRIEYDLAR